MSNARKRRSPVQPMILISADLPDTLNGTETIKMNAPYWGEYPPDRVTVAIPGKYSRAASLLSDFPSLIQIPGAFIVR